MVDPKSFGALFDSFRGYLDTSAGVTQGSVSVANKVNRLVDQFSALTGRDYSECKTEIQNGMGVSFIDPGEYRGNLAALNGRLRNDFQWFTMVSDVAAKPLYPVSPSPAPPAPQYTINNTVSNRNEVSVQITQELLSYINGQLAKPLPANERSFLKDLGERAKGAQNIIALFGLMLDLAKEHKVEIAALAALFAQHMR